jgi:hypothetical protein
MSQSKVLGNLEPPDSPNYLGIYHTQGGSGRLELGLSPDGSLGGCFSLGDETLEVRGISSAPEGLYGVLLDPQAETLAVFRASLTEGGLTLELDIPGGEPDFSEAEMLQLIRAKSPPQEGGSIAPQEADSSKAPR